MWRRSAARVSLMVFGLQVGLRSSHAWAASANDPASCPPGSSASRPAKVSTRNAASAISASRRPGRVLGASTVRTTRWRGWPGLEAVAVILHTWRVLSHRAMGCTVQHLFSG